MPPMLHCITTLNAPRRHPGGADRFWNRESVRVSYAGHTGGDRSGLQLFVGGPCPHPLPGGSSLGLSLLVLILVPAGVYFTVRTRFLPFRLFPEMMRVTLENNKQGDGEGHISGVQALIVSTACRVAWATWWAWWRPSRPGARGRCSGCGSSPCWALPPPSSRPPWPSCTRRRTPSTAGTGAARPTTCTTCSSKRAAAAAVR